MVFTSITVKNWRNFVSLTCEIEKRFFVVGSNAVGKSNFLDIFRFLSDIVREGGGFQSAIARRGGLRELRSLHSRNENHGRVLIDVEMELSGVSWRYALEFGFRQGTNRTGITSEEVARDGEVLLKRPTADDDADDLLLTQTHLEQLTMNKGFRPVYDFFSQISYFHPVPQLIRSDTGGGARNSEFGVEMIRDLNALSKRDRKRRLEEMEKALQAILPAFKGLEISVDSAGVPHLKAGFHHWRAHPADRDERSMSDGTLRFLGLVWALQQSPLKQAAAVLLEEPELSLNSAVVSDLAPFLMPSSSVHQSLISTHSPVLLSDEGVRPSEVLVLQHEEGQGTAGTVLSVLIEQNSHLKALWESGWNCAELVSELSRPVSLNNLRVVGA